MTIFGSSPWAPYRACDSGVIPPTVRFATLATSPSPSSSWQWRASHQRSAARSQFSFTSGASRFGIRRGVHRRRSLPRAFTRLDARLASAAEWQGRSTWRLANEVPRRRFDPRHRGRTARIRRSGALGDVRMKRLIKVLLTVLFGRPRTPPWPWENVEKAEAKAKQLG